MTANQEIELKFELEGDEAAPRRLKQALEQRFGPGRSARLTSTYFDTADLALREAAMSLRIRKAGRKRVQTLKAPAAPGGRTMFARGEWEQEVRSDQPDLSLAVDTPLAGLLGRNGDARHLAPAFQSVINRTVWDVATSDGAFELALDRGAVKADGRESPVCELEVELKAGAPASLLALARSLDDIAPLRLGGRTKADRGYELIEKTETDCASAETVAVTRDMTAAEGFQAIARGCLRHFLLNQHLLQKRPTPGALHQSRVALRRLRSAMSLFKHVAADDEAPKLKARIKALSQRLGEARNLDVFIEALEAAPTDASPLQALARKRRDAAYADVAAAMAAVEARRMMFDLAFWIEAGDWTMAPTEAAGQPLEAFAAGALRKRRKTLKSLPCPLDEMDAGQRHQVRIDAKKLRYAAEFFEPLYSGGKSGKRAAKFTHALKGLQQALGELNDIVQAEAIAATLAEAAQASRLSPDRRRAAIFAAGEEVGRRRSGVGPCLKAAAAALDDTLDAKPFWS